MQAAQPHDLLSRFATSLGFTRSTAQFPVPHVHMNSTLAKYVNCASTGSLYP